MFFLLMAFLLAPFTLNAVFVGPPGGAAGVVEREIQEEYVDVQKIDPLRPIPLLEVEIPDEQLNMNDDATVLISHIEISGNACISSAVLKRVIRPFMGKDLSMNDIHQICLTIQKEYLCRGYFLARAYPPEQDITNGFLTIKIIEGSLGEIFVVGNCFYKKPFICSYFSRFQNYAVNYDQFIKTLLLINENMDLTVGAVFKKSPICGKVDLILNVIDKRPVHLYLNTNNYGSSTTTKQRTGGRLDYGNFLMNGDKFSVAQVVGSPIKNLLFTDVRYQIPLTRRGTNLHLAYLHSEFDVGVLRPLKLGGRSDIASGKLKQAIGRKRCLDTDIYLNFDYKQIKNRSSGSPNAYDKMRNAGVGFTFDWTDCLRGRNIGDLHFIAGIPGFLGGSSSVDSRASRSGSGAKFWINYLDYTRVQQLFCDMFLMLQASGQYTNYKLPYAEQMYLGGAEATRGYPVATVLGDKGVRGSLELRTPIPLLKCCKVPFSCICWKDVLQLVFFCDYGKIWLNGGDTINQKNNIDLYSVGAGFRVYGPWKLEWSFDAGFPLAKERKTSNCVYYFKVSFQAF